MYLQGVEEGMLAIMQETQEDGGVVEDRTLDYFFLLLIKVALNTLVLSFWLRSIKKSLLGICGMFICVVDLLLVTAVAFLLCWQRASPSESLCYILSHVSTIYARLPLPLLLMGVLDCSTIPNMAFSSRANVRLACQCAAVVLMWALTCVYSYHYTNSELVEVEYKDGIALVCPVEDSTVLTYFITVVFVLISCVLLLYLHELPRWLHQAHALSKQRHVCPSTPSSDLPFTSWEVKRQVEQEARAEGPRAPLFASLTLCFTLAWMPYLLMTVCCNLLGFAVPAYISINLLWVKCANSLLTGVAYWYRSEQLGPCSELADDVCSWTIFWHLSKGSVQSIEGTLSQRPHSLSVKVKQAFPQV